MWVRVAVIFVFVGDGCCDVGVVGQNGSRYIPITVTLQTVNSFGPVIFVCKN